MAARAIGTSTISFGLVTIPVKLYATSKAGARVSFNWLDRKTGVRVRQQYFNPDSGEVVPKEDMVKGYQFAKNQFVLLEPDELKVLEQPKTDSIEIAEFVPADEVERVYYDRAYYLGPDRGAGRAYRLLAAALERTGRVAIARFATRGKQYLVMVRPYRGGGLLLEQLRYQAEVRSWDEVPVEEGSVDRAELDLAVRMIEQRTVDGFEPGNYADEVRERQLELIQRKIDGEQITVASPAEPQAQIIDLMAALKKSIAGEGAEGGAEGPATAMRKAAGG